MSEADLVATRPYRRRIVGGGLLVAAVVLVIGAPLYIRAIENDLERRVPDELEALGIGGISVSFSGQQGTVRCVSPLADPEGVLDVAYSVRGVQSVELDRSCRVSSAPTVATTLPSDIDDDDDTTTSTIDAGPSPAFDSLVDVFDSDPQFSILSSLVAEAGLTSQFQSDESFTVFAPDDAAFERLPADVLAELRQDPKLLAEVIRHHVIPNAVTAAELVTGQVTTLLGSTLAVVADGRVVADPPRLLGVFTVDGAGVTGFDLTAVNGVVHVIDRVLLPDGLELGAHEQRPVVIATLDAGTIDVAGSVADAQQRGALIAAAGRSVAPENITDGLTVDPVAPVDAALVDALGAVLDVAAVSLSAGSIVIVDGTVVVRGTYVSESARDSLIAAVSGVGGRADVRLRPVATADEILELDALLGELVAGSPLEFEPTSPVLVPGSAAILDRIAGLVKRYEGTVITVAGFTDTSGSASVNQTLSEQRAASVAAELVERGIPFEQLVAVGFGETRPVIVNGVEDVTASRRVEVGVAPALPLDAEG